MDEELYQLYEAERTKGASHEQAMAAVASRQGASEGPGMAEGLTRAGLQGATLGFSDEISSAMHALPRLWPGGQTFGEAYTGEVTRQRDAMQDFRQEHPVAEVGAQIVGAIGTGKLLAGPTARAAGTVARAGTVGHAAAEGAILGGVAGAGTSEGGPMRRLAGLTGGAALGAGAGMAAKGIAAGGRAFLDATGLRPSAPAAGAAPGVTSRAAQRAGVETVENRADDKLLEAMRRDRITTGDVRRIAAENPNKPLALVDAGDEEGNLLGLARAAKTLPGEAKRDLSATLRERSTGELSRVRGDLARRTGLPQEFADDTAEEIVRRRSDMARPLYERLENQLIKDPDETFTRILDDPAFANAYERAARIARREGYKVPELYDEAGKFRGDQSIPVRVFDYLNRGLRDMRKAETGMGPDEWRSIQDARTTLLSHVDELVPEFREARRVYAGESALLDALEEGEELFRVGVGGRNADVRTITKRLAEMTPDEKSMYRRGAIDSLLAQLGDVGDHADQAARITRTPNLRDKVRLLFDNAEEADAFLADMGLESRMQTSRSRLSGGSPTAEIQASQADALQVPRFPTSIREGINMGLRGLGSMADRAQGYGGKMSETLAQRLTAGIKSRADLEAVLKLLDEREAARAGQVAAGGTARRVGASQAGRLAGGR